MISFFVWNKKFACILYFHLLKYLRLSAKYRILLPKTWSYDSMASYLKHMSRDMRLSPPTTKNPFSPISILLDFKNNLDYFTVIFSPFSSHTVFTHTVSMTKRNSILLLIIFIMLINTFSLKLGGLLICTINAYYQCS